jgi:actin beta/gamma 1
MTVYDGMPIVMDNGTKLSKVGFAGEDSPREVFFTIPGIPRDKFTKVSSGKSPIERGIIKDWRAMERIWSSTFKDLGVDPSKHPVLLTQVLKNPKKNKEKIAEIMFETFNVPKLYLAYQGVLALYASGRTTGIVLGIGEGAFSITPIYEGYALTDAMDQIDLAGLDITLYLEKLLKQGGFHSMQYADIEVIGDIKEKLCYVALDAEKEKYESRAEDKMERIYTLPLGQKVEIGNERFLAPECLFNPSLIGKGDRESIARVLVSALNKCDYDVRVDLFQSIVLSGGTTLLPGLADRLIQEIRKKTPPSFYVRVVAPPERMYSVWIGGSVVGSLRTSDKMFKTKKEYREKGSQIFR